MVSNCCNTRTDEDVCPRCRRNAKAVEVVTLKSLLVPEAMKRLDPHAAYHFCRTVDCPVVYFNGTLVFAKDEVTVRMLQKESTGPLPVCYCFGFTRESIADEMERTGTSTAVEQVTRYVKDGKCACELRNPQGSCCLGNVPQAVEQARRAAGVQR
ncbi:MAG: (2Fe-2S)-binding protein [Planctomycetia bacterium]|nr:(2Fe-2S)-binding protein [Planctomycetia bacterium]